MNNNAPKIRFFKLRRWSVLVVFVLFFACVIASFKMKDGIYVLVWPIVAIILFIFAFPNCPVCGHNSRKRPKLGPGDIYASQGMLPNKCIKCGFAFDGNSNGEKHHE